jgi:hypothetical protein
VFTFRRDGALVRSDRSSTRAYRVISVTTWHAVAMGDGTSIALASITQVAGVACSPSQDSRFLLPAASVLWMVRDWLVGFSDGEQQELTDHRSWVRESGRTH